jgi:hypothetical protein
MESQKAEEKKIWIKPQLVVYGDIEKLTTELPVPVTNPPSIGGSGYA